MNNNRTWLISLAFSLLLHGGVLAFFLINKNANENFLDGLNADIGEFAAVSFVANLPVGELKSASMASEESKIVEEEIKEITEEKIIPQEIEQSSVEVAKQEEVIQKEEPKPVQKPKKVVKKEKKPAQINSVASVASTASSPVKSEITGEFKTQIQGNSDKAVKKNWQGLVMAHIFKFKNYPQAALEKEIEGIATISVSVDRSGTVLNASVKKSSGSAILDNAALATFKKASPIPAPPSEIIGMNSQMTFNMPINYNLKD